MSSRVVYFDHKDQSSDPEWPFKVGEAGFVWIDEEGDIDTDVQVRIPPNAVHALHGHGVVDQLNKIDLSWGPVGNGRDAVVGPGNVEEVARLFYEADRMTYGAVHDLRVDVIDEVEYRIVINNREYQRTLSRLQFMSVTAGRLGHGLRLKLG